MRTLLNVLFLLGLLFMVSAGTVLAETMYAKKDRVKVTTQKSPTSKVVATLNTGDAVEVVQKSGRQYQVKLSTGQTGWVFKFKLSDKKPAGRTRGGSGLSGLTGKSTIAAREARAGGSIRGLKETTEQYATNKRIDPAHKQSVDKMEQRVVSADELARFQREGGVGEFAGGVQ